MNDHRHATDRKETVVIPKGTVDCAFCGVIQGNVHREASLGEFADGGTPTTDPDETVEYLWAGDSPFLAWDDLLEYSRLLVLDDLTGNYVDELLELASRLPYLRHVYLSERKINRR
jgi:hypothetical protein